MHLNHIQAHSIPVQVEEVTGIADTGYITCQSVRLELKLDTHDAFGYGLSILKSAKVLHF